MSASCPPARRNARLPGKFQPTVFEHYHDVTIANANRSLFSIYKTRDAGGTPLRSKSDGPPHIAQDMWLTSFQCPDYKFPE